MTRHEEFCRHCGLPTKGGEYLPGHNSRHVAVLVEDVLRGGRTIRQARAECDPYGGTWGRVVDTLDNLGYYRQLEQLAEALGSVWLETGYELVGQQVDKVDPRKPEPGRVDKLSAVRAYFVGMYTDPSIPFMVRTIMRIAS